MAPEMLSDLDKREICADHLGNLRAQVAQVVSANLSFVQVGQHFGGHVGFLFNSAGGFRRQWGGGRRSAPRGGGRRPRGSGSQVLRSTPSRGDRAR